ncbi:MAG: glycosyltransferase family 2 protein [Candidatus Omnitrophica bacterium]|nr:glycosyltransferase family 2 protein [Candidatus Omnitrophota bacterium]
MKQNYSISAVIPMYNEESYVADVVYKLKKVLESLTDDFEIIAVDDSSTDNTLNLLQSLSLSEKCIKIVRNPQNLGLGGTLRAGFNRATKDLIFYTDADLPCDLSNLKTALTVAKENDADIVAAYRSNRMVEGLKRFIYSRSYNLIIRLLFGVKVKDINFSFKLFKSDKLKKLDLFSNGSFIDSEIIIKAKRSGYKIVQIPLRYCLRQRGVSKLDNFSNIRVIICEIFSFIKKNKAR